MIQDKKQGGSSTVVRVISSPTGLFRGGVEVQSFVTALRVVLNRYFFGRLVHLDFQRESVGQIIVITAEILYPFSAEHPSNMRPIPCATQIILSEEEIHGVCGRGSDDAQAFIQHLVERIVYKLATIQEPKAS